jgi:hypothetical protein
MFNYIKSKKNENIKTDDISVYNFYNNMGYLKGKYNEKQTNTYELSSNKNVKYLVLMACHCSTEYKLLVIKQNIKYFINESIDILIINSAGLPYNNILEQECSRCPRIRYKEISNDKYADFGKWITGLRSTEYSKYNFVICTNDSFIIMAPIDHYFNLIYKNNVELYGYTDSTERRYHYQSYLFTIKREAITNFISNYDKYVNKIHTFEDVITYYELTMIDWFNTKNCFLQIGNLPYNLNKNIFFKNIILYNKLKALRLLPFIKIKYISSITNKVSDAIKTIIISSIEPHKYENKPCDDNDDDDDGSLL